MAISVTPNLTDISLCDATTGWAAVGGTNTLNVDVPIQGSGCIHNYSAAGADRGSDYDFGVDKDLSLENLYFWFALSKTGILGDYGSTGMRIRVTDSAGVWGEWYLFGKNTVAHNGWIPWTVRISQAYDVVSGGSGPSRSAIRKVGWRANAVLAKGYIYFDAWRYGTGLKVTEGTDAVPATWEHIFAADDDSLKKYGVISKFGGIYYLQGQIQIGDSAQTVITYFKDTSKVIVFKDARVDNDFYKIEIIGTVNYKTSFVLGDKSGTAGISGCVIIAQINTKTYKIIATNANIDAFGLYGCTFFDANIISLPVNAANHEVLNTVFEKCAEVVISTCIVKNCNFISSDGSAVLMSSISHNTTYCNFISCLEGVKIDTYNALTYPFNALIFSGTTYHVNNTSGSTLTVGNSNGANASTYTGTLVNFTGSVVLTMTVKNEAGQVIVDAWAYIDPTDESPFIMNKLTNSSGIAQETYTGAPVNGTRWRVRKYGYKNFKQLIDIGGSNISLPITLVIDPQQI